MTPLKKCTKCGEEKPATREFWPKHSGFKSGLNSICKSCESKRTTEWRRINRNKNHQHKKVSCVCCGETFTTNLPYKKYCSSACKYSMFRKTDKRKQYAHVYGKQYYGKWRDQNRDKVRKNSIRWRERHPEQHRNQKRKMQRRHVSQLVDSYVIKRIKTTGCLTINDEVISLKRKKLKALRMTKQIKQKIKQWHQ